MWAHLRFNSARFLFCITSSNLFIRYKGWLCCAVFITNGWKTSCVGNRFSFQFLQFIIFAICNLQCHSTNCENQMNDSGMYYRLLNCAPFSAGKTTPNNTHSECVHRSTLANNNNLWIHMICGHSYVYWDVRYDCNPCFIHQHSNQCRPFQIKTFHTIDSIFSTWKQTVSSSPQIHADKWESTNKKKENRERRKKYVDNFTMEWKWLELQFVWCDKVSIPMLIHSDMLIFFKEMKSRT